jgi:hypothetical protein
MFHTRTTPQTFGARRTNLKEGHKLAAHKLNLRIMTYITQEERRTGSATVQHHTYLQQILKQY